MTDTIESSQNILYGGPDCPTLDPDARSLGEVALKKFADNGDNVILVSVNHGTIVDMIIFSLEISRRVSSA